MPRSCHFLSFPPSAPLVTLIHTLSEAFLLFASTELGNFDKGNVKNCRGYGFLRPRFGWNLWKGSLFYMRHRRRYDIAYKRFGIVQMLKTSWSAWWIPRKEKEAYRKVKTKWKSAIWVSASSILYATVVVGGPSLGAAIAAVWQYLLFFLFLLLFHCLHFTPSFSLSLFSVSIIRQGSFYLIIFFSVINSPYRWLRVCYVAKCAVTDGMTRSSSAEASRQRWKPISLSEDLFSLTPHYHISRKRA